MNIDWSQAIIGIGIYLFSLRLLHSNLSRPAAIRMKPILDRYIGSPWSCLVAGVLLTLTVGSDSVAVIGVLAVFNASLISLEQALFLTFGAGIASVLGHLQQGPFSSGGLFLVMLVMGILLLWIRKGVFADMLEMLMVLCICHIGLNQIAMSFRALQGEGSFFFELIRQVGDKGLIDQIQVFWGGFLSSLCYQEAGSIFWIMSLNFDLDFAMSSLWILGSNMGAPLLVAIALLEFQGDGRRLVLAWFLIKFKGVLMTWFFLPYFLTFVDLVIPGEYLGTGLWMHLSGVQGFLNLFTVLWGLLFAHLLLRLVEIILPTIMEDGMTERPPLVLRMLASSPERAQKESTAQLEKLKILTKSIFDQALEMLLHKDAVEKHSRQKKFQIRTWHNRIRSIRYLIFFSSQRILPIQQEIQNRQRLKLLNDLDHIFQISIRMQDNLEQLPHVSQKGLPLELNHQLQKLQQPLNEIFLMVLAGRYRESEAPILLQKGLDALDKAVFEQLGKRQFDCQEAVDWLHQVLGDLRKLVDVLMRQLNSYMPVEERDS